VRPRRPGARLGSARRCLFFEQPPRKLPRANLHCGASSFLYLLRRRAPLAVALEYYEDTAEAVPVPRPRRWSFSGIPHTRRTQAWRFKALQFARGAMSITGSRSWPQWCHPTSGAISSGHLKRSFFRFRLTTALARRGRLGLEGPLSGTPDLLHLSGKT